MDLNHDEWILVGLTIAALLGWILLPVWGWVVGGAVWFGWFVYMVVNSTHDI